MLAPVGENSLYRLPRTNCCSPFVNSSKSVAIPYGWNPFCLLKIVKFKVHLVILVNIWSARGVVEPLIVVSRVADDSDLEPLESEILDLEDDCEDIQIDPANCVPCKQQPHPVFRCKKFNDLSVNERFNSVKRNNLCINCFSSSHKVALCKSLSNCPNCSKRLNSLLCRNFERNVDSQRSPSSKTLPNMEPTITPTLNVNSECFQPKLAIPSCVESFENGGEFVGHSKGHSTRLLSPL
ncbi:hypothetical protein TNCV_153871 [Trichonephila clavipes]|nr:hypothetical protein TNCV_153871 [Trichonephila clavipes]